MIDEVRIYDRALSPGEILSLYQQQSAAAAKKQTPSMRRLHQGPRADSLHRKVKMNSSDPTLKSSWRPSGSGRENAAFKLISSCRNVPQLLAGLLSHLGIESENFCWVGSRVEVRHHVERRRME